MLLREYLTKKIAEAICWEMFFFLFAALGTIVIAICDRSTVLPAVCAAFFLGAWIGRMIHAPEVEVGLHAVSDEELDALRKQRRHRNE